MYYSITYVGGPHPLADARFDGLFEAAREEALAAVEAGECDSVEVRDAAGAICYRHPHMVPES